VRCPPLSGHRYSDSQPTVSTSIFSKASKPTIQPCTTSLARRCKSFSHEEFFAESPGAADDLLTEDSSTEDSGTEESETDEDRAFVVQDESGGSEEEYIPPENSSEDDYESVSSNSDRYALSDGSDNEFGLGDMYVGSFSDIDDASAAKGKPRHSAASDDKLRSPPFDGPAVSRVPRRARGSSQSPVGYPELECQKSVCE
jgi:hypothetical protein